jgi:hypothetical protein
MRLTYLRETGQTKEHSEDSTPYSILISTTTFLVEREMPLLFLIMRITLSNAIMSVVLINWIWFGPNIG